MQQLKTTPDFRVLADSKDVTARIRDRLLSLTVTDEAGFMSDEVTIRIDDREDVVALPRAGAELEVYLGYAESGLVRMGLFKVDEISHGGPPATITIKARAADMRAGMKSRKARSWDSTTLGEVAAKIAAEHGYEVKIAPGLATAPIAHEDQLEESDMHFLTRLAKERDAVFKPAGGCFVLAPRGEAKAVSGKKLAKVTVQGHQVIRWNMSAVGRGKFKTVTARYHDTAKAERLSVSAGQGEPGFILPYTYPDAAQAMTAAKAKLAALERGTAKLELTVVGDPGLVAEARLTLSGLTTKADGEWSIIRAIHKLDGQSGYTCSLSTETPKGNPRPIV